jgi:hypothetical protein
LKTFEVANTLGRSTLGASTGSDPEIFVEDALGEVIPAYTFLPPKDLRGELACYHDGFQAEFEAQPGLCQDGVALSIRKRLAKLAGRMPEGSRFSTRSVVEINPYILRHAPQEVVDFGCRPSLNAYGMVVPPIPDPREFPIRFAGGHIHWGLDPTVRQAPDYPTRILEAIKMVDATIGLLGVSLAEGRDDPRRREHYGLAGEYRLPKHGVEYRTLSNFWLATPAVYHLVFTLGRAALRLGYHGHRQALLPIPDAEVVEAINTTNPAMARDIMQRHAEFWRQLISYHWGPENFESTWAKCLSPMSSWGVHLENLQTNWATKGWDPTTPNAPSSYPQRWITLLKTEKGPNYVGPNIADLASTVPAVSGDAVDPRPSQPTLR